MKKKIDLFFNNPEAGFSVLEIMLAVAVFVTFSSGVIFVILQGFDANRLGNEEIIATEYATEGIEAARSIKNQNFANLVVTDETGIAASSSGVWKFSGTNNTFGKYNRVVSIENVQRNINGNIVASGAADPNTKKVISTVTWNVSASRADEVELDTYFTDWKSYTQSVCLSINTSSASSNKKQLLGITLRNLCPTSITLTKLTPTWTQSNNRITQVQINGITVWSSTGIGSPSGNQNSGTTLTLVPLTISSNTTVPLNFIVMSNNIKVNESWTLTFTLSDSTQTSVSFVTP